MMTDNKNSTAIFSLGIAGNSAGHLQQTGESKAFGKSDDTNKPQALFPLYVPGAQEKYLASMPYSSGKLRLPDCPQAKVQMEPELALKLTASYGAQGELTQLQPVAMTLVNDVTYRNAQITKLAQKKNWGAACKGLACHEIKISDFSSDAKLDAFRLCGFHQRNGDWHLCGEDVALTEYSYFYNELLQWLLKQIEQQQDNGVFHNIQTLLAQADYPETLLIAIGATRYSAYGQQHQLLPGDQSAVVLYDSSAYNFKDVVNLIEKKNGSQALRSDKIIILQQEVI